MDIAIHLGAHCTDEDRVLKALLADAKMLSDHGVIVPPPGRARPAIRKALQTGKASLLPDAAGGGLAAELTEGRHAVRVVVSNEGFLGAYAKVMVGNQIYADAGAKTATLRDLFPGHQCIFYFGIRNPATFIPALFDASTVEDFGTFVAGQDVGQVLWSPVIDGIRQACPDVPLVVWCNEDLPLIWPDVLRQVSGAQHQHSGDDMIVKEVMTEAGYKRLQTYLRDNPAPNLATWRKVITAFLGKYADSAKTEEEIALPGWSQEVIATLTDIYERDVQSIRARADITFIAP